MFFILMAQWIGWPGQRSSTARWPLWRSSAFSAAMLPVLPAVATAVLAPRAGRVLRVGMVSPYSLSVPGGVQAQVMGLARAGVEVLGVPLILVLGHDDCGAIQATMDDVAGILPASGRFIHHLVDQIKPTVLEANAAGKVDIDEVTEWHVHDTINEMLTKSDTIAEAVKAGKLGVVGANYKLALGEIHPIVTIGELD